MYARNRLNLRYGTDVLCLIDVSPVTRAVSGVENQRIAANGTTYRTDM